MEIRFGPAGLGPAKTALEVLESYHNAGLRACEIAFTYSVYLKSEDAEIIGKKAREFNISLSIHAPYFVNLNSAEKSKVEATKKRILDCCKIGEIAGARVVVFHPGYYSADKKESYSNIKRGIIEIMREIEKQKWKIKIAPETMGKINVFGSVEEISSLVRESGCSFCIDFAHILARDKKVDYAKIEKLFQQEEWHCHFSGIEYGEKGERKHLPTPKEAWEELLKNLPRDKKIVIINESPTMVEDSIEGLKIFRN